MKLEQNYFTLLGQSQHFFIDAAAIKQRFRQLQRQYHPDRYAGKSPQEQRLAVQFSAHINTAYAVLDNPVRRAQHMLALKGIEVDHQNSTISDTGFLMAQMETREALDEARATNDRQALEQLLVQTQAQYQVSQKNFARLIDADAIENSALIDCVGKMQFYEKLTQEITTIVSGMA